MGSSTKEYLSQNSDFRPGEGGEGVELASWGIERSKENCYRCAKKALNDRFEGLLKKNRGEYIHLFSSLFVRRRYKGMVLCCGYIIGEIIFHWKAIWT